MTPRPLAEILTYLLAPDDLGAARTHRLLRDHGVAITRGRLLDLAHGARPSQVELEGLGCLGVTPEMVTDLAVEQ